MWSVTPLHTADLASVMVLEQQCFSPPWSEATLRLYLNNPANLCLAVRLNSGSEVLHGFAVFSCFEHEAELLQIAVADTCRGQGVASLLLGQAHQQLAKQQVTDVLLEVNATNTAAVKLYEKFAYRQDGCRKNYYLTPQGRQDALLMRTQLVPESGL